jgi:hypothetical protein
MQTESKPAFLEPALLYGSIIGVFTVFHAVIVSISGANFSTYNQIAGFVIPVAGLIFCLRAYRIEYLNGYMNYGQSFKMGFVILVIAGLITLVYTYVYIQFINPDYFRDMAIVTEEKMIQRGMSDNQIEIAMEASSRVRNIKWTMIIGLLGVLFSGAIISLVVSAFMKKESNEPFRDIA